MSIHISLIREVQTEHYIDAYMNRPHSAHGIYTPEEVLEGRDNWLDVKAVIAEMPLRIRNRCKAQCFLRGVGYSGRILLLLFERNYLMKIEYIGIIA